MSKRSCPRCMSSRVSATGSSLTNLPSVPSPAYIALSSRKNPRATVSAGGWRAFCPFGKKGPSESGFTLAWSYISLRHAAASVTTPIATMALSLDIAHLHGLEAEKEEVRVLAVELGVARFDAEEVAIARGEGEALHVE